MSAEDARPIEGPASEMTQRLLGAKPGRPQRRGKQAFLPLAGPKGERFGLALHFGMTGRIALTLPGRPPPAHARLSLTRDGDGLSLHFCDARRFGRVALAEVRRIGELPAAAALGPDPVLDPWSPKVLARAIEGTRRPIKDVIMDQGRIAGIGNIYASESLWRARISPSRPASELEAREIRSLARSIRAVLDDALALFARLRRRSASRLRRGDPNAFEGPIYLSEGVANPFSVYARRSEPCPRCRRPIVLVTIAARSSFACPSCQR